MIEGLIPDVVPVGAAEAKVVALHDAPDTVCRGVHGVNGGHVLRRELPVEDGKVFCHARERGGAG